MLSGLALLAAWLTRRKLALQAIKFRSVEVLAGCVGDCKAILDGLDRLSVVPPRFEVQIRKQAEEIGEEMA